MQADGQHMLLGDLRSPSVSTRNTKEQGVNQRQADSNLQSPGKHFTKGKAPVNNFKQNAKEKEKQSKRKQKWGNKGTNQKV